MHDKQIADEECCNYPEEITLRQDKGFEGYHPEGVTIVEPFKKPKGGELTYGQKWYNYVVSQERIVVEHAIGGIRRCRIVKERNRLSFNKRDAAMEVCTGLHNFRVKSPFRSYSEEPLDTRTWAPASTPAHVYDFFPN